MALISWNPASAETDALSIVQTAKQDFSWFARAWAQGSLGRAGADVVLAYADLIEACTDPEDVEAQTSALHHSLHSDPLDALYSIPGVPQLVLYHRDAGNAPMAREVAAAIPGAQQRGLEGDSNTPWAQETGPIVAAIEAFLSEAGVQPPGTTELASDTTVGTPSRPTSAPEAFAGGRYRVIERLGAGQTKTVYRVRDSALDRDAALALIDTQALSAEGRTRLRDEARALGRLGDHPNIVTIFDLGEEDGRSYFVSEYLAGGDLRVALDALPGRRMPLPQALRLARALLGALAHAHAQGIVHRDLKPANIWLTTDGTPKLGDFGIAHLTDRTQLTQTGDLLGTAAYMSPEQCRGEPVDARSDLYALGCVLYEAVTGGPPFQAPDVTGLIGQHLHAEPAPPSRHNSDCPPVLDAFLLGLLAKRPADRPDSAAATLAIVERLDVGGSQRARP